MRKLLVFLMLLIVLLVVLDRVAVAGVQRDLANRIAAATDVTGTPEVTIEGIPFLTQAISGHYPEVRFDLGTLSYGGVPIENLKGAAYDVTAPLTDVIQNRADIRAGRLAVTGTVSSATIDRFAPQGIKVSGKGDRFVASGELMVGAQKVKFTAEMRAELADGGIRLQAEKIEGVPDQLARLVNYTVPFKGKLPFDVKVTEVKSVAGGLQISAEGTDVPLRG
ncbi:LmeA family phospholipid-binding protein [Nonomuraea sp. NPDC003214]